MKLRFLKLTAFLFIGLGANAQDPSINIITQQSLQNDGIWPYGATDGTVDIQICNNPVNGALASHRIYAQISVPQQCVAIASTASQTLPTGWHITSNDGQTVFICNGTDQLAAMDCANIDLKLTTVAVSNPAGIGQTVTSTIGWFDGTTNHGVGPQTTLNNINNDNSVTTVVVTNDPLPVLLKRFWGNLEKNSTVKLSWDVASEENLSRYEIQRSTNGVDFEKIGIVKAENKTTYDFTDNVSELSGKVFYRLKLIDNDGKSNYSNVLDFTLSNFEVVELWPNPISDVVNIKLHIDNSSEIDIKMIDVLGKVVVDRKMNLNKGVQIVQISNLSEMPNGLYSIAITQNGKTIIKKVSLK